MTETVRLDTTVSIMSETLLEYAAPDAFIRYVTQCIYQTNLNIWTDRFEQTVQTRIRPLPQGRSDQGLHCLPFHLHSLGISQHSKTIVFHFMADTLVILDVLIFRILQYKVENQ